MLDFARHRSLQQNLKFLSSLPLSHHVLSLPPWGFFPLSHHGDLWPHPDPWWLPMGWGERASQAPLCPVGVGRGSNIGRWTSKPTGPCWCPQEISACFSGCFRGLTQLQCLLSLSLAIKQMYMKKSIFHLSSWPKECVCGCVWVCVCERERERKRLKEEIDKTGSILKAGLHVGPDHGLWAICPVSMETTHKPENQAPGLFPRLSLA